MEASDKAEEAIFERVKIYEDSKGRICARSDEAPLISCFQLRRNGEYWGFAASLSGYLFDIEDRRYSQVAAYAPQEMFYALLTAWDLQDALIEFGIPLHSSDAGVIAAAMSGIVLAVDKGDDVRIFRTHRRSPARRVSQKQLDGACDITH
ncbi:MAG TPA: hypothetical protein DDW98_10395 [Gammaproteobacteria bacterium]|nr:hypothetical protein [Gammaproteobacteria bacterium]